MEEMKMCKLQNDVIQCDIAEIIALIVASLEKSLQLVGLVSLVFFSLFYLSVNRGLKVYHSLANHTDYFRIL